MIQNVRKIHILHSTLMKEHSKGDQRNSFIREVVMEKGVKGYGVILSFSRRSQ